LPLTLYENGFFASQNLGVAVGLKCCSVSMNGSIVSIKTPSHIDSFVDNFVGRNIFIFLEEKKKEF
jgi:hypothetical protein